MTKIVCIGMGPGSSEYVTPLALAEASRLPILLGEERFLKIAPPGPKLEPLPRRTEKSIDRIRELLEQDNVGVLVSGDPCFFSLGNVLVAAFGSDRVRLVPGISSIQILASKIGRSWGNVPIISLHGRSLTDREQTQRVGEAVFLLGGRERVPEQIRFLAEIFDDERIGVLGWDLGTEDEHLERAPLGLLAALPLRGRLALLWMLP